MKMSAREGSRTFCQRSETDVRVFFTRTPLHEKKESGDIVIKLPIVCLAGNSLLLDNVSSPP